MSKKNPKYNPKINWWERGLKILQVKGVIIHGNSKERQPILKKWEGKVKMKSPIGNWRDNTSK